MQKSLKLAAVVALIISLAACGASSLKPGENKAVQEKKAQLEKMKADQKALNDKVTALEAEIIKLDPSSKKENTKLVAIAKLAPENFTHYIDLQGKLDATNIAYVAPRGGQGGLVKELLIKQGDNVKKGQLLMRLDNAIAQKQIDQLNTQLTYAKDMLQRQQNLWDQKIGTEVQLVNAKNNVANIEKQIAIVNEQSSFSNVYAEMSGVAEAVNVRVGEIFVGGPQIQIINTNDLKVVAQVPENYLEAVNVGSPLIVNFPEANKTINAKVSVAGKLIDPLTRSFYIEAKMPYDKSLRPNQIAIVQIQDYTAKDVITIPVAALQNDDKGKFVMVAVQENGKMVARKKMITIGQLYKDKVEIKSGVQAGDQIITEGFQGLYDRQPITTSAA